MSGTASQHSRGNAAAPTSRQPASTRSGQPRRVLIAYSMASTFTSTTQNYLLALKRFSDFEVDYIHVTHDARMNFDINDYDVVINNYCARFSHDGYVSKSYEECLHRFRGLKIIAVQDDYDRTATLHRAIRRLGFHVLLTCIQPGFWRLAYPASELPGLKIIQGFTGYMPEDSPYPEALIPSLAERQTWLAYRGRRLGAKYGRLGFEKEVIGTRMKEICAQKGIPHDIAVDEDSRLYGEKWFEFLGSSRAMLGSESGCNVFDFDGDVERRIADFKTTHGREPRYEDLIEDLAPIERHFDVGQISPRVFESALMRTPMVLFRGSYSGAIKPEQHYIALERDFSNVDHVFDQIGDLELLQGISDRTYGRLVTSGLFGYSSLATQLADTIRDEYPRRVDPAWVEFRAKTGMPCPPPLPPTEPATEEEIRQLLLVERPTDEPCHTNTFIARQEALAEEYRALDRRRAICLAERQRAATERVAAEEQLHQQQSQATAAAPPPPKRSVGFRAARVMWRLLPNGVRLRIASRLRNILS